MSIPDKIWLSDSFGVYTQPRANSVCYERLKEQPVLDLLSRTLPYLSISSAVGADKLKTDILKALEGK